MSGADRDGLALYWLDNLDGFGWLDVIWTGWLSNFWRRSRRVDMLWIGWLSAD